MNIAKRDAKVALDKKFLSAPPSDYDYLNNKVLQLIQDKRRELKLICENYEYIRYD